MGTWYANFFKQDTSRIVEWLNKCVRDIDCGLAIAGPVEGFEAAATEIDHLRAQLVDANRIIESVAAEQYTMEAELAEAKARVVELEAYHTNCTDYINGLLGNMADDDKERVAILARAEKADAERDAMREVLDWIYGFLAYVDSYHSRMIRDRVRAALAPSPAGREG